MGLLLYLVGLLALVSGFTKLRRAARSGPGRSSLAVAEMAVGTTVVLASALGLARSRFATVTVVVTVLLVIGSLSEHMRRSLQSMRGQLGSEAERLERHIVRAKQADGRSLSIADTPTSSRRLNDD